MTTIDFSELLRPVDKETFFSEYWEKKPLHVTRGESHFCGPLFSRKHLDEIICTGNLRWGVDLQLPSQTRRAGWTDHAQGIPDGNKVAMAYAQGDTIILNETQMFSRAVAHLCRDMEAHFHFLVNAVTYLTPPASQGLPTHFDIADVFVLQVEGSKRWRVYDPDMSLPLPEHLERVSQDTPRTPILDVMLAPGDLLFIPRGFLHDAVTGDESSLHVTLSVAPLSWKDFLVAAINQASLEDVRLRHSVPTGFVHQDPEMTSTMTTRAHELFDGVQGILDVAGATNQLARMFLRGLRPLPGAYLSAAGPASSLRVDTSLRKRPGSLCLIAKEGDSVRLLFPGNSVSGPSRIEGAFRFIASHDAFAARDLPDSLTENAKLVLTRRLVKDGLLTIEERGNGFSEPSA